MAKGFDVTGLSDFTKKASEIFLKSTLLREGMSRFSIQTGISHKEYLNFLDANPDIQAGACGLTPSATNKFSEKEITVVPMGIFDAYCLNDLAKKDIQAERGTSKGKWNEMVRTALVQSVSDNVARKIDKLMWAGKVSGGDLFDGLHTIAAASANTLKVAETGATSGTNVLERIDAIASKFPDDVFERGIISIHVSQAIFNMYKLAIRDKNYFCDSCKNGVYKMPVFGWEGQFQIIAERGMAGIDSCIATWDKNLFIGVDEMNEVTELTLYFNPSTKNVELSSNWKLGVQIGLDNEIAVMTIA